jgi:hypothetical protein
MSAIRTGSNDPLLRVRFTPESGHSPQRSIINLLHLNLV